MPLKSLKRFFKSFSTICIAWVCEILAVGIVMELCVFGIGVTGIAGCVLIWSAHIIIAMDITPINMAVRTHLRTSYRNYMHIFS